MTLPTSSARSGPAAANRTAFGLPSSIARDVGQIDRRGVHLEFVAPRQLVEEAAQPEALEIDGAGLLPGRCGVGQAHSPLPFGEKRWAREKPQPSIVASEGWRPLGRGRGDGVLPPS